MISKILTNHRFAGFIFIYLLSITPSAHAIDSMHQLFHEVLQEHVSDGQVDYPGIDDDPRFEQYIDMLVITPPPESADGRLAYWINAYNALTIQGILDGRSPSTFFGRIGFFKNAKYRVNNMEINLYDLERDILIALGEPRIHFAIVCASLSCPILRSEAYVADKLDRQLEVAARNFINDTTRNRFDRDNEVAYLSKIFDWFDDDFADHAGSVLRYVAHYVSEPPLANELVKDDYKIRHLDYDWSLNGQPPKT